MATSLFPISSAFAQTKSLKLYYIHTGEKATITYKKNGRYIASGLKKINWHLRDWRRNEPTKMDPKLLDLVWEVYRQSGSKAYITVISGYRSPASNNLLRKRGRGVAKNSQHTLGKALDFYLPDVKLATLRKIGLKMEVGGVGYYPTSGSPFVHLDVGSVRHWPRMSRKELVAVFPDGKTMHVPTDGKPLARYEQAVASYKRRSATGKLVPEGKPSAKDLNFFQRLAGNTKDDEVDDDENNTAPAPRAVSTSTTAPAPKPEPVETPEPVIVNREIEFAALPSSVPVPILAPRANAITSGQAIEVATLTPAPEIEQTIAETAPIEVEAEEPVLEEGTVLASLNLPVPVRRPNFEAVIADAVNEPASEENASNALALAETNPTKPIDGMQVAALTPQEIEDLRAIARPSIAPLALNAPTPAVNVGGAGEAVDQIALPSNPAETSNQAEADTSKIISAALADITQNTNVPTPIQSPLAVATTAEPITQERVEIEPGTISTGRLSVPTPNPVQVEQTELAAVTPETTTTTIELSTSVPVPIANPKRNEIILASLETENQPQEAVKTPEINKPIADTKPLGSRTISLDQYSAPQENSTTLGQWALSSETTIRSLAEVQAPAYGRNIIRQVPETILVQGFNLQRFGPGRNNFKGKAVTAMRFAKLEIE
ncbi:MAG: DUF882 domain-containing protein [Salaquimonas sp.]